MLSSCLDLTTSLIVFTPSQVLENLAIVFLPYLTSVNDDFTRPWEIQIERSLMGHVMYGTECSQSRYVSVSSFGILTKVSS